MVAAAGGHYDALTALLKAKANPNHKNKASGTALHEAAAIADAKIVSQLLYWKADPNIANEKGHTALMMAAATGTSVNEKDALAIVKQLASKGSNLEARDEDGRTALFLTAMAGHVSMVEALIGLKADKEATDKMNFTPLMAAAASGQVKMLEVLIKAKANLEAKHQKGGTALHVSSSSGQRESVELLLNNTYKVKADVAAVDEDLDSPLHLAVYRGHYDVCIQLMRHGADVHLKNKEGKSPLSWAEENKEKAPHLVELLNTGGDKEKVKEFLLGIINAAKGEKAALAEEEAPKGVEGAAPGGKKLGRVPGLGKAEAKAEL
jgi:ankyrin repeat protein